MTPPTVQCPLVKTPLVSTARTNYEQDNNIKLMICKDKNPP